MGRLLNTNAPTQSANNIYAGPTSGGAAVPAFRSLVSADIPSNAANTSGSSASCSGNAASSTYSKDIPQNSQTGAYQLAIGDIGKHISITTGGVTVPSGTFSAGDVVTIFNNSVSNQTITQGSSVTLHLAGGASTGNRTLAEYGICTVLCTGTNIFVISGAGLT